MALNSKGQAALTDSLYFLLIVSGLSTFLFLFAATYGQSVSQGVGLQYRGEYAVSTLKTILYSSTPRLQDKTLEQSSEVDFLLAAMKEDFADDGLFSNTEQLIVNNVAGLMAPLAPNFDYMYYIYLPDRQEFVFFLLHTSKFTLSKEGKAVEVQSEQDTVWLCKPDAFNKLDDFVTNIGKLYQANSRMQLPRAKSSGGRGYDVFASQVNLTMWVSTGLPEVGGKPITDKTNLDCTCHQILKDGKWQSC